MIERNRLRDAVLSSLRDSRVTLLLAPSGSGKTTLLQQVRDALDAGGAGGIDASDVTIIDEFDGAAGSAAARALELDMERCPSDGRRLLLASDRRLDGLFSASRMRGAVREFTLDDFALAEDEVAAFLGEALTTGMPTRTRRILLDRTEGWLGAWNVLRELLQRGASAGDLARSFSGRDRDLSGYFDRCVMAAMPPALTDFLCEIAPLRWVSEGIARAATGRSDCATMIRAAVEACGFFFDIDRNGDAQRPHRLFRDYLVGLAKARAPERYAEAALRGAEYAAVHGDWLLAASLFSEANAPDRSVEILRRYADDLMVGQGDVPGYRRLLTGLLHDVDHKAALSAEQALGSVLSGDFAGAAALVAHASEGELEADDDGQSRLETIRICIDFGLERFQHVRRAAPRWLDLHAHADPRYRAMVAGALYWSSFAEHDGQGVLRGLELARDAVRQADSPFLDGWQTILGALYHYEYGQAATAARLLDESVETGRIRHTVDLIRATVALEQGRFGQARQLIHSSLQVGARHSVLDTSLYGWHTAARLALRDESLHAALRVLQDAEAVVSIRHGERGRRMIRLRRATLILQNGGEAFQPGLKDELDTLCGDAVAAGYCASFTEEARLTLARYHSVAGDPRRAISLLQPIQAAAQRGHRTRRWGVASLIYAGALAMLDQQNRAVRQAWAAIAQMHGEGYLTSIADEHLLLRPLIEDMAERLEEGADTSHAAMRPIIEQLAARSGRHHLLAGASAAGPGRDFVALTDSEVRVLSLAAHGCSNAEIADRSRVQVTTVKWHMTNIFAKLSVRSRTAAIVQARRLGLEL